MVVPSLAKEAEQLSHDAPRYAAELRGNPTFRHYDNRYHITATLVRDTQRLPQLLGHVAGPLKDVTVQAFGFTGQLVTALAISFLLTRTVASTWRWACPSPVRNGGATAG